MTDVSTTPAGWYPDPEHPGFQRYWDGMQWAHYRQPYPPMHMQQQQQVTVGQPKQVNHLLHLVLSLLTFGLWVPVWILISMAKS